jgi:hypothetical protein
VARDLRGDYRVGVQIGAFGLAPLLARSSFSGSSDASAAQLFFAGMAQNGAKVRYTQRACRRMAESSSPPKHARFLPMNQTH